MSGYGGTVRLETHSEQSEESETYDVLSLARKGEGRARNAGLPP